MKNIDLKEEDVYVIYKNICRIITLINDNGCKNPPDMKSLKVIKKNVEIYFQNRENFDELAEYITKDWDYAMRSQKKIIDCYIPHEDIDKKAQYNKELEICFMAVERKLQTHWIHKRRWYTVNELYERGRNRSSLQKPGDNKYQSLIEGISDEVWTYAKYLAVAPDDESLKRWFYSDIPAFGYISLYSMSRLKNGENIVRAFISKVPFASP